MARLFQVSIAAEDYQVKSPLQVALLNPNFIQIMDDASLGSAQTNILYKKHHGDTAVNMLINAPVSALTLLINAATGTNSVKTIQVLVRDDEAGTTNTLDIAIENIWKVIDDPSVSALGYILMDNQPGISFRSLHVQNTLAAIAALANA